MWKLNSNKEEHRNRHPWEPLRARAPLWAQVWARDLLVAYCNVHPEASCTSDQPLIKLGRQERLTVGAPPAKAADLSVFSGMVISPNPSGPVSLSVCIFCLFLEDTFLRFTSFIPSPPGFQVSPSQDVTQHTYLKFQRPSAVSVSESLKAVCPTLCIIICLVYCFLQEKSLRTKIFVHFAQCYVLRV